ncbi:MAG: glycine betaine ABC transporter substrate-binding protein [Deferribacterota bacterium]|nr:glycine betaine ABC transporter substrate-binding protein [Deferribacterota bacterium]
MLSKKIGLILIIFTIFLNNVYSSEKEVTIPYVEWTRCVAITHVAGGILEDLGYDVSLKSVANAAMWASVASGSADALLCAWLPITHADLYKKYKKNVEIVQTNYKGTMIGLVVPSYVKVDKISELHKHKEKFDGKIIGIDPGAGMSKIIDNAIENNLSNLGVFKHVTGSEAIMIASLDRAIKRHDWIVVPLWKPHWVFSAYDLKVLKDENNIFGEGGDIYTVVHKGLKKDDKLLYTFFKDFDWTKLDLGEVMIDVKNRIDPKDSAEKFIKNKKEKIDTLLKPILKTAK